MKLLSKGQFRGLQKLGDAFIPGDSQFPSFSQLGCAEHFDRVGSFMPASDLKDLKLLFSIFRLLPTFEIRLFLRMLEAFKGLPGPLGGLVRFVRIGVKGLVVTLYYSGFKGEEFSGPTPLQLLDYEVSVYK